MELHTFITHIWVSRSYTNRHLSHNLLTNLVTELGIPCFLPQPGKILTLLHLLTVNSFRCSPTNAIRTLQSPCRRRLVLYLSSETQEASILCQRDAERGHKGVHYPQVSKSFSDTILSLKRPVFFAQNVSQYIRLLLCA